MAADYREQFSTVLDVLRDIQDPQARPPTLKELAEEIRVMRAEHLHVRLELQRIAVMLENMQNKLDRHSANRDSDKDWPS